MNLSRAVTPEELELIEKIRAQGYIYTLFTYWGDDGYRVFDERKEEVIEISIRYTVLLTFITIHTKDYTLRNQYLLDTYGEDWWLEPRYH